MKGEYVEPKTKTPNMFSKLQHNHLSQSQTEHLPFNHPHPFQLSRECQTSEEDDSRSSGGPTPRNTQNPEPNSGGDGATIEVGRRPRGRPPGSKNKPKPPVYITRDTEPAMSPYILEVPGGNDVVDAIARYCSRKNMGLCVLTGSGTVANVTLRQPSSTPGATVTFHGRFDILSISATFLPQQLASCSALPNGFTISLAGPQGQIVGGIVSGGLIAAGTVFVVAASFNNPSYQRLPAEDELRTSVSGGGGDGHSPSVSAGGGGDSGHAPAESCGVSMYSCHLPSDVIWARPPQQPPPPY
ncbi:AT-hook motif nuclear-localized protein [Quillaja saponaria]|uniref:AT-hook motif nuclear-localized protein n=1 Tax=Quillaja saponaria TaxID=32244 RepID=A0AAD7LIS7_QUISA|nr:AT-hook motif nuclear-localized protein [Quillaja saponaria]